MHVRRTVERREIQKSEEGERYNDEKSRNAGEGHRRAPRNPKGERDAPSSNQKSENAGRPSRRTGRNPKCPDYDFREPYDFRRKLDLELSRVFRHHRCPREPSHLLPESTKHSGPQYRPHVRFHITREPEKRVAAA